MIAHNKPGIDHHDIGSTSIGMYCTQATHTTNQKILNTIAINILIQLCDILANEKFFDALLKRACYYNAIKQSEYNIKSNIVDGTVYHVIYHVFWDNHY